jgi:hypothetical protein
MNKSRFKQLKNLKKKRMGICLIKINNKTHFSKAIHLKHSVSKVGF